ncbi:MAG: cysteine hydrolase [Burkholderiales bacterium]|nr:cysteine hydrolase [Burkholderiales bacterium]
MHTAVLLLDLQVDFLDSKQGRMPVGERDAARIIAIAAALLSGSALEGALPVLVVNAFPQSQHVANFFRNHAALAGSAGAELDPRIRVPDGVRIFAKSEANAFSNPDLHTFLQSKSINRVCVVGVYAEGCVRATALGAKALGYAVSVPLDAIATNGRWKMWIAKRAMRAHGVEMPARFAELMGTA